SILLFCSNYHSPTSIHTLSLPDALPISTICDPATHSCFPQPPRDGTTWGTFPLKLPSTLPRRPSERHGIVQFSGCTQSCAYSCLDRKSTRLNSSHGSISYAVFCLKKKK